MFISLKVMQKKIIGHFTISIVSVLFLFSCGLKTAEKKVPNDVVEFKNGSCIKQANSEVSRFFKGSANESEIDSSLNCYTSLVNSFRKNIRGIFVNGFSDHQVFEFITTNFLSDSDFQFTESLKSEIMQLKVLLFGGSRYFISYTELSLLSDFFQTIKPALKGLNSHMALISGPKKPDLVSMAEIRSAQNQFKLSLSQIFQEFKPGYQQFLFQYSSQNLIDLIHEALIASRAKTETLEKVELLKPLFRDTYAALVNSSGRITESDWLTLSEVLADAYMTYRRSDLMSSSRAKKLGLGSLAIEESISELRPLLVRIVQRKEFQHISNDELKKILRSSLVLFSKEILDMSSIYKLVEKVVNLENKVDETGLNFLDQLLNVLWSHILNDPDQRINLQKPTIELDGVSLSNVLGELQDLFRSDYLIKKAFIQKDRLTKNEIINYLNNQLESQNQLKDNRFARELLEMLSSRAFLVSNEKGYLKIMDPTNLNESAEYSLSDLEKSNYARAFASLIIRGFSNDFGAVNLQAGHGLSLDDTKVGWALLRPAVVELDLVDAKNLTFIISRHREADLFISSANGDGLANFSEVHDLVLHIASGKNRSDTIKEAIIQSCLPDREVDSVKSGDVVSEKCLLDFYFNSDIGFEALPEYLNLKKTLTQAEHNSFALSLLKAAGYVLNKKELDPNNRMVEFGDLNLYPHIAQYIEMIFFKYDLDQNGVFPLSEAEQAWPLFAKTFEDVVKSAGGIDFYPTEDHRKGLFLFMLHNGGFCRTAIECRAMNKFVTVFPDKPDQNLRLTMQSNRFKLGGVFNSLSEALKPDKK